jgi:SAM-dependent methyltransferase
MITIPEVQDIIMQNNPHGYYHIYNQYEELYWGKILEWILELKSVRNILDIGCAYLSLGLFSKLNHNAELYAIDFVQYASNELINKYNINYKISNIELDEFPWNTKFDQINITEVLEHLRYSPLYTLNKLKDLLTDNGVIFMSTPDSESSWGKVTKFYNTWEDMPYPDKNIILPDEHIYTFALSELLSIFYIVGLKVDKLDYSESGEGLKHFNIQLSKIK